MAHRGRYWRRFRTHVLERLARARNCGVHGDDERRASIRQLERERRDDDIHVVRIDREHRSSRSHGVHAHRGLAQPRVGSPADAAQDASMRAYPDFLRRRCGGAHPRSSLSRARSPRACRRRCEREVRHRRRVRATLRPRRPRLSASSLARPRIRRHHLHDQTPRLRSPRPLSEPPHDRFSVLSLAPTRAQTHFPRHLPARQRLGASPRARRRRRRRRGRRRRRRRRGRRPRRRRRHHHHRRRHLRRRSPRPRRLGQTTARRARERPASRAPTKAARVSAIRAQGTFW
mmetsp:Transcript_6483/g.25983  ORF Transcript_6483/g.25983 Transcript_6483/m.25983 type:complete len:288 (-) Transcript_6483:36-899(-)